MPWITLLALAGPREPAWGLVRGHVAHDLFQSEDGGATWAGIAGFIRDVVDRLPRSEPTTDGDVTHSVLIDPRDAAHL